MSGDQRFFDFLKRRIGLDVASVGPTIIERAVRQRCTQLQMADEDQYWYWLSGSPDEQQALIEAVIVPETWFFRYPESFATLGRLALKRLGELKGQRGLRILSLPCSTGEEPYSIAMALFDAGLAASQFSVEAMDISPLSVERAQRGVYGKNSFRGQHLDYRERYFSAVDRGYELSARIRDQVRFSVGNLLDPMLLNNHPSYDFVFCRNLLIYFDLATQQQALDVLKRLTHVEGVLFIGPAEGSLLNGLGMRSIGVSQSFAFSHSPEAPPSAAAPVAPIVRASPRPVQPATSSRAFAPRAVAPVVVAPVTVSETPGEALERIACLANAGKTAEARRAGEAFLNQHGPHAEAFYWLGLLSDVEGQAVQAQTFYRKALYLDPQHAQALIHLSALLASRGDLDGARRLQERAARSERSVQNERKQ